MTREEAVEEIWGLSCGTLSILTGLKDYDQIDDYCREVAVILMNDEIDVAECENWIEVWETLKKYRRL